MAELNFMGHRLVHTLAFQWDETDNSHEGFLCVCGDIFVLGKDGVWDPGILQFSEHLKEMNAPPVPLIGGRGNNDPKPEKPPGDDPRSGNPLDSLQTPEYDVFQPNQVFTANYWRKRFGLEEK